MAPCWTAARLRPRLRFMTAAWSRSETPRSGSRSIAHEHPCKDSMLRVAGHSERTDVGRQRQANEDSYLARAPLFVVADGMGGAQAGEVASLTAIQAFQAGLPEGSREEA